MTLSPSALPELLDAIRVSREVDVAREADRLVARELIELEAAQAIGAACYERTDERTTHRNGSRPHLLSTTIRSRSPSARAVRDEELRPAIVMVHRQRVDVHGGRMTWNQ